MTHFGERVAKTTGAACAVLLHLAALPTVLEAQRVPSQTDTPAWSVREAIPAADIGGSVRWPSLTSLDSRFVLVSDVWADLDMNAPEAADPILWQLPGGRMKLPVQTNPTFHSLVADGQGRLHVFWSESEGAKRVRSAWSGLRTNITHARLDIAGWTPNETIVRGVSVGWRGDRRQLAVDSDGNVHLITSAMDTLGYNLSAFKLRGGEWRRSNLAPGGLYETVTNVGRNTLVAAYQGRNTPEGVAPIQVFRSTDNGESWSEPILAAQTQPGLLIHLQLLSSEQLLALFWVAVNATGDNASVVTSWSKDSGQTWSEPQDSRLGQIPRRVSAVSDGCGGIVALIEARNLMVNGIASISMTQRTWSSREARPHLSSVFSEFNSVFDSAIARDSNRLMSVFTGIGDDMHSSNYVAERNACPRVGGERIRR